VCARVPTSITIILCINHKRSFVCVCVHLYLKHLFSQDKKQAAITMSGKKEGSSGASSAGSRCCRGGSRLRLLASLLYVLIALVSFTLVARHFRIRVPGLGSVWRIGRMFRKDYSAVQARRAAIKAAREAYKDTAIITLATGDSAAKHAIVLLKTLRDSGTQIPNLVVLLSRGGMGSADCHNETLRNARNRHYPCSGPLTQVSYSLYVVWVSCVCVCVCCASETFNFSLFLYTLPICRPMTLCPKSIWMAWLG
jgi:hypothetical protein